MSGFISGAIDPALLSGGGGNNAQSSSNSNTNNSNSPAVDPNSSAAHTSSATNQNTLNPSSSVPPTSSSASAPNSTNLNPFPSNLNNNINHAFNMASSSSSIPHTPQASTTAIPPTPSHTNFLNGSAPTQGTPNNHETLLVNGMSLKEHEMHQKDQELAQFLLKMEDYKPVIPDEVAAYYLQRVGFECTDIKVQRLLVLACQKFVSDIAQDAFSYARTRTGQAPGGKQGPLAPSSNSAGLANGLPNNPGARKDRTRTVLTQEDLAQALAEYGINASRAPYYL